MTPKQECEVLRAENAALRAAWWRRNFDAWAALWLAWALLRTASADDLEQAA